MSKDNEIDFFGPFWSAKGSVELIESPNKTVALRPLYSHDSTFVGKKATYYKPDTLLARVTPSAVTATVSGKVFDLKPVEEICVLELGAEVPSFYWEDFEEWRDGKKDKTIPELTAIEGRIVIARHQKEIPLDLYKALSLEIPGKKLAGKPLFSVTSSGFELRATVSLFGTKIELPLLLVPTVSDEVITGFRLIPDRSTCDPEEIGELKTIFSTMQDKLNGAKDEFQTVNVTFCRDPLAFYLELDAGSWVFHSGENNSNLKVIILTSGSEFGVNQSSALDIACEMSVQDPNNAKVAEVKAHAKKDGTAGDTSVVLSAQKQNWKLMVKRTELAPSQFQIASQLRELVLTDQYLDNLSLEDSHSDFLYAVAPTVDGCIQIPFPNVTEELFGLANASVQNPNQEKSQGSLFDGAISVSNITDKQLPVPASEHPWAVVVSDAVEVSGTWNFDSTSADYETAEIEIMGALLILEGFFWLDTSMRSNNQVLPEPSGWTGALRQFPLLPTSYGQFKPAFKVGLSELSINLNKKIDKTSHNSLDTSCALTISFDPDILKQLNAAKKILENKESDYFNEKTWPFIAWRRHQLVPMIQALPLTQIDLPPNKPSSTRQFMPCELKENVTLTYSVPLNQWPNVTASALAEDRFWQKNIPLVSLSIPGLILQRDGAGYKPGADARNFDTNYVNYQYRHDLPYMDEVNALTQLPNKNDGETKAGLMSPKAAPVSETCAKILQYHKAFDEKAALAALENVKAISANGALHALNGIFGTYTWPVTMNIQLNRYPGKVTFTNNPTAGGGIDGMRFELDSKQQWIDHPLEGISRSFSKDDTKKTISVVGAYDKTKTSDDFVNVLAGSMHSHSQKSNDGTFRFTDQSGLKRVCDTKEGVAGFQRYFLSSMIDELDPSGDVKTTRLISFKNSIPCTVPNAEWQLWLHNIPLDEKNEFDWTTIRDEDADVNVADARAIHNNYKHAYEWRLFLEEGTGASTRNLSLYGLQFYPLHLHSFRLDAANDSADVIIAGRLQLPSMKEHTELQNTVHLKFKISELAGNLSAAFDSMELPNDSSNCVLLIDSDSSENLFDSPRLFLEGVSTADKSKLSVTKYKLQFLIAGQEWIVEPSKSDPVLEFTHDVSPRVSLSIKKDDSVPARPTRVDMSLATVGHQETEPSLALWFEVDVGIEIGSESIAKLSAVLDLLNLEVRIDEFELFKDIKIEPREPVVDASSNIFSLGVVWDKFASNDAEVVHFLPGWQIKKDASNPGSLAVGLQAIEGQKLVVKYCRFETVVCCAWGELDKEDIDFSSSSGRVLVSITSDYDAEHALNWQSTFMVNGQIQVCNLICIPASTSFEIGDDRIIVPEVSELKGFDHYRHFVTLLFNDHTIAPLSIVSFNDIDPALPKVLAVIKQPWHFISLAQHRLVKVIVTKIADKKYKTRNDGAHNWTVIQESSLSGVTEFADLLSMKNNPPDKKGPFPINPVRESKRINIRSGYHDDNISSRLIDRLKSLAALPLVLVECSFQGWIKLIDQNDVSEVSEIKNLPFGDQLSKSVDYGSFGPKPPGIQPDDEPTEENEWIHVTIPFIGRTQPVEFDIDRSGLPDPVNYIIQRNDQSTDLGKFMKLLAGYTLENGEQTMRAFATDWSYNTNLFRLDEVQLQIAVFKSLNPVERIDSSLQNIASSHQGGPGQKSREVVLNFEFENRLSEFPAKQASDNISESNGDKPQSSQSRWGSFMIPTVVTDNVEYRMPNLPMLLSLAQWLPADKKRNLYLAANRLPFLSGSVEEPAPTPHKQNVRWRDGELVDEDLRKIFQSKKINLSAIARFGNHSWQQDDDQRWQGGLVIDPEQNKLFVVQYKKELFKDTQVKIYDSKNLTQSIIISPFASFQFLDYKQDRKGSIRAFTGTELIAVTSREYKFATIVSRFDEKLFVVSQKQICDAMKDPAYSSIRIELSQLLGVLNLGTCEKPLVKSITTSSKKLFEFFAEKVDSQYLNVAVNWLNSLEQQSDTDEEMSSWIYGQKATLANDSPIILIRRRNIDLVSYNKGEPSVQPSFEYDVKVYPPINKTATRKSFSLRSDKHTLRFVEGQFTGDRLPDSLHEIELVSPIVAELQPIYRTFDQSKSMRSTASGINVRYWITNGRGAVDKIKRDGVGKRIWWQSLRRYVVYKTGGAGLPQMFRADPIKSLLPRAASQSLPVPSVLADEEKQWQTVLPESSQVIISGSRAGAFYVFEPMMQTQDATGDGGMVATGFLPTQNRCPRPVPLPPNVVWSQEDGETEDTPKRLPRALRTWANYLFPEQSLSVSTSALDEFYRAKTDGNHVLLRMQLLDSAGNSRATVSRNFDGKINFRIEAFQTDPSGTLPVSNFHLDDKPRIFVGDRSFLLVPEADPAGTNHFFKLDETSDIDEFRSSLALLRPGQNLEVALAVNEVSDSSFKQLLKFKIFLQADSEFVAPMRPRFIKFEDPEYNDTLSSEPWILTDQKSGLKAAVDRRKYGNHDPLYLLSSTQITKLTLTKMRGGAKIELETPSWNDRMLILHPASILPKVVDQIKQFGTWQDGDLLIVSINEMFEFNIPIVVESQLKAPTAGYALLRLTENNSDQSIESVQAAIYSWGPNATQIELVEPKDLFSGLVRRRAIFRWFDSVRDGNEYAYRYAIQKIHLSGSTHIPLPGPLDRAKKKRWNVDMYGDFVASPTD